MSKRYKILLGLLVALLVVLTYFEAKEPNTINWLPSYTATDKIPLGSMVLFEHLKQQEIPLERIPLPPYEFLSDSMPHGSYLFLNNSIEFPDSEWHLLLDWISQGNTAFLIAEHFSDNILDTLQLKTEVSAPKDGLFTKPLLNLSDPRLKLKDSFLFDHGTFHTAFKEYDSLQHWVLGQARQYTDSTNISLPEPNFLMDSIGKGAIYLHSTPWAFSNFFLLDPGNHKYAAHALAYVPREGKIFWDAYYKAGKGVQSSPLYVLLNENP